MEKSYGEIEKRNTQGTTDDVSKNNKNVVVGHPLPKDEIISDTFQRIVNTHDVQGKIIWKSKTFCFSLKKFIHEHTQFFYLNYLKFVNISENVVKTNMAQDLGLISRRGVERLMRGDVDPDRLIEEAQHVKSMDLYKKYAYRFKS